MLQVHVDGGTMPAASTRATRVATDGCRGGVATGAEAVVLVVAVTGAATLSVVDGLDAGAEVVGVT
jgi:hypothetical protein